jgi:hypothetical protein
VEIALLRMRYKFRTTLAGLRVLVMKDRGSFFEFEDSMAVWLLVFDALIDGLLGIITM